MKRLSFRSHYPDGLCEPLSVLEIDKFPQTGERINTWSLYRLKVSLTLVLAALTSECPAIRDVLSLFHETFPRYKHNLYTAARENPRDGGAWWAAIYRVAQSWTRLKRLSSSSSRDFLGSSGKEPTCQCQRHKRRGFDP